MFFTLIFIPINCSFKTKFYFLSSFKLSWVDYLHKALYRLFRILILNSDTWFAAVPATEIHFSDHFSWRLISKLIKGFQVFSKNYLEILMKPLFQIFCATVSCLFSYLFFKFKRNFIINISRKSIILFWLSRAGLSL